MEALKDELVDPGTMRMRQTIAAADVYPTVESEARLLVRGAPRQVLRLVECLLLHEVKIG